MVIKKIFSNSEILNKTNELIEAFKEDSVFPVKINFFLQKNINNIMSYAKEIDNARMDIIKKYGVPDEEDFSRFIVPNDKMEGASAELEDLLNLEQEISFNMIDLDWFGDIQMTSRQVAAISDMINYEEEEEKE